MTDYKVTLYYDEKKMTLFADGYFFDISKGEEYNVDDKMDNNREMTLQQVNKFNHVVSNVHPRLKVVYEPNLKYYLIAYIGVENRQFYYTEAYEILNKNLNKALKRNKIGFK